MQREELYQEVRTGVNLMTDPSIPAGICAHARIAESGLRQCFGNHSTLRAGVSSRHHARSIDVLCGSQLSGWFDQRKLERALYNLLLNACEAAPSSGSGVEVIAGEFRSDYDFGRGQRTGHRGIDSRTIVPSICQLRQRKRHGTRACGRAQNCAGSWRRDFCGAHPHGKTLFRTRCPDGLRKPRAKTAMPRRMLWSPPRAISSAPIRFRIGACRHNCIFQVPGPEWCRRTV